MSDFSDSDYDDTDPAGEVFNKAAQHVQSIHGKLQPNDLLQLYAYFKQATCGRCNISKPGILQIQGRAKWTAWNELGQMPSKEAKRLYVEKIKTLDTQWYAALQNNVKSANKSGGWVVHSIQLPPDDDEEKAEHEKSSFDFVKEGNLTQVMTSVQSEELRHLDEHGMGMIHWAADRNFADILTFLLSCGADVNFRDADQQTPLHYAASCGHLESLRVLLAANADRSALDAEGNTCIDVAENAEVRGVLLE